MLWQFPRSLCGCWFRPEAGEGRPLWFAAWRVGEPLAERPRSYRVLPGAMVRRTGMLSPPCPGQAATRRPSARHRKVVAGGACRRMVPGGALRRRGGRGDVALSHRPRSLDPLDEALPGADGLEPAHWPQPVLRRDVGPRLASSCVTPACGDRGRKTRPFWGVQRLASAASTPHAREFCCQPDCTPVSPMICRSVLGYAERRIA